MSYGVGLRNGAAFGVCTVPSLTTGGPTRPSLLLNFFGGPLDSRITFARSSSATFFNSTGVLSTASSNVARIDYNPDAFEIQNLLTYSSTFSNAVWTKQTGVSITSTTVIAPDNTPTATEITWPTTPASQGIFQAGSTVRPDLQNTKSIYVRADVAGGTVELADPNGTTGTPAFTLTTSWQRITLSETQPAGQAGVWLRKTASSPSKIYIWGAQLNQGSTALGLYQTQASAFTQCVVRGLLIESARTNNIRNNTMQGAVAGTPGTAPNNWLVFFNGITGVSSTIVGTGTQNGINYIDIRFNGTPSATVAQGIQILFEGNNAIGASASQTWAHSSWVSIVGGNATNISGFVLNTQQFDTGVFVQSNNTSFTPTSTFTRYSGAVTFSATLTTNALPCLGLGVTASAAIDITLRIGLPQLELGTFASSVIPTSTIAVARTRDEASIPISANWYNQTAGTVVAEAVRNTIPAPASLDASFGRFFSISDGTTNNAYSCGTNAGLSAVYSSVFAAGVETMTYQALNMTAGAVTKVGLAISNASARMALNNVLTAANSICTMPTATTMTIGQAPSFSAETAWSGWIRSIRYYPLRLPNETVQNLTA